MHMTGSQSLLCTIARRARYRMPVWTGLVAALTAMAACAAVYGISRAAGAIPHDVLVAGPGGQQPLNLGLVLAASAIAATAATLVFMVLNFTSRRALRRFQVIAAVVFLVSLLSPFSVAGAPAGMIVTLLAMHVLTAGISVGVISALAEPVQ